MKHGQSGIVRPIEPVPGEDVVVGLTWDPTEWRFS
jgi:hypothetical protein